MVTGAFIVCWLPFFLTSLSYQYCESCSTNIDSIPAIRSAVKWLHYLNSCLNPIIYAFLNPTFKLAFKNIIRGMCGKEILYSGDTDTSFMSLRSRQNAYNNSLRRDNSGKKNSESVPNGILMSHKKPLLYHEDTKMNGTVKHESISDDGSVERGIETPEDKRSVTDQLCPTTPPPSYNEWYEIENASNNNDTLKTDRSDNVSLTADDCRAADLPEPYVKPSRTRSVSFMEEVEVCGENTSEKESEDIEDLPVFQGHFSTYHDQENNRTYLLVDGVTVPESEIKTSDV